MKIGEYNTGKRRNYSVAQTTSVTSYSPKRQKARHTLGEGSSADNVYCWVHIQVHGVLTDTLLSKIAC
jgi:hypothetical protein